VSITRQEVVRSVSDAALGVGVVLTLLSNAIICIPTGWSVHSYICRSVPSGPFVNSAPALVIRKFTSFFHNASCMG
jgi:hypothetical protein